jgi:murein DD-endopeptidase MepM/ murein hydrolase activator NlpD
MDARSVVISVAPTFLRALVALAAVVPAGCGAEARSSPSPQQKADAAAPLKPHPRVVVALAPGEQPPPGAVTAYGSGSEAQSFKPPSDAEVKAELAQLHASKLSGSQNYTDPLAQIPDLAPERIDMGVDYAGAGPVLAVGDGTVFNTRGPGWPGGIFIGITLANGPYAGLSYFVAENIKPTVRVGDHVRAGEEIGVMYHGPAGIETGWAAGQGDQPLAAALGQQNTGGDPGAWTSAAGLSFDRLLISTGTASGIPQGTKVHGKMPAQYP